MKLKVEAGGGGYKGEAGAGAIIQDGIDD